MDFPAEVTDHVRELHFSSKMKAQQLRDEAEEALKMEKVWADCLDFIQKGWALHFLTLLEKEAARLKKLKLHDLPTYTLLEDAYKIANEESDIVIRQFPRLFEEACKEAGISIESDSRHPRYNLERGFFRLEIDDKKHSARLSDHEGRLADIPADIGAILEIIQREHKRVFGRSFNGAKFLKSMRAQYKAILKKEKQPDGSSIPIRLITRRLGKNIKGFRTDEFLVDISRLAEGGPLEIEGRRLDLQQTKDTNQGMLLHGNAARGYVGFVIFKEV